MILVVLHNACLLYQRLFGHYQPDVSNLDANHHKQRSASTFTHRIIFNFELTFVDLHHFSFFLAMSALTF